MSDYILNDDGTVTFEFDGFTRILKRPTLGEYRTAVESLGSMRDAVLTEITADESTQKRTATVQIELVVDWFDNVFTMLSGEGLPKKKSPTEDDPDREVVDEERLPPWLISAEVVADLINHWQTNPSRRGGR